MKIRMKTWPKTSWIEQQEDMSWESESGCEHPFSKRVLLGDQWEEYDNKGELKPKKYVHHYWIGTRSGDLIKMTTMSDKEWDEYSTTLPEYMHEYSTTEHS